MSLRTAPPRPTLHRVAPAYPRVIAVGALLLAGCGGIVDKDPAQQQPKVQQQTPPDAGGADTATYVPDTGVPDPVTAGDIAFPYDGGTTSPPTAPPTDTGVDTAVDETDPNAAGGIAAPFDAGTATPSDPAPIDAGPAPSL